MKWIIPLCFAAAAGFCLLPPGDSVSLAGLYGANAEGASVFLGLTAIGMSIMFASGDIVDAIKGKKK